MGAIQRGLLCARPHQLHRGRGLIATPAAYLEGGDARKVNIYTGETCDTEWRIGRRPRQQRRPRGPAVRHPAPFTAASPPRTLQTSPSTRAAARCPSR
jgi:hypothetical protein